MFTATRILHAGEGRADTQADTPPAA